MIAAPPSNTPQRLNLRWLLLTVFVVFLAHFPFAIFRNEFQDGWIHVLLYERGAYGEVFKRLMDNGRPVAGWLNLHAMTATGFAHGAIWLSVLSAVLAGAAWYATFIRTGSIAPRLAFVMAVLSAVTPANQIILSTPTVIFVSAHAFFALGIWLFLEAHLYAGTFRGVLAYGASCTCGATSALLGEATAPMLLLYPLVTLLVDGTFNSGAGLDWRRMGIALIRRSAPVLLGAGAFAAMFVLFQPVGAEMISERRLSFQPVQIALSLATFLITVLMAYLPLWLGLVFMTKSATGAKRQRADGGNHQQRFFLFLAFSTAVLALSPYIAALRLASPAGWGLRYLYYFGSSLAWLLAALVTTRDQSGRFSITKKWTVWLTVAIVAGLLLRWPFFAVRTVHEDLVALAVSESRVAHLTNVFVVDDRTDVMAAPLRDVEWTGILQKALKAPQAVAAIASPQEPESTWTRWRFQLRQRMGWAPPIQPVLTPAYLREHVRALQGYAQVGPVESSCAVSQVDVTEPSTGWFLPALVWYFRSSWDSEKYHEWLMAQVRERITIEKMPLLLDPCH